jgi:hypothetical protein
MKYSLSGTSVAAVSSCEYCFQHVITIADILLVICMYELSRHPYECGDGGRDQRI